MEIEIFRGHECSKAKGLCVVIDVLRAFTTAAYAFAAGASEIIFVSSTEEAFQLHQKDASLILMGEEGGKHIAGFHFGNSPSDIQGAYLSGQRIVQRTSCGTLGVVNCSHAERLLIASFVVAEATVKRIVEIAPTYVSFVVTGVQDGDEDLALAEYLRSKLLQQSLPPSLFLDRVRFSPEGKMFADPEVPDFSEKDLELALKIDRFSFAMEVEKRNSNLVAKKVSV